MPEAEAYAARDLFVPVPEAGGAMTGTPDSFPEELLRFVDDAQWTFAKTMPEWPHEYVVRNRVDDALFERAVKHIRANGYEGRFYQKAITYYDQRWHVYWTMGAPLEETIIINRSSKEASFQARAKNGTLPVQRM